MADPVDVMALLLEGWERDHNPDADLPAGAPPAIGEAPPFRWEDRPFIGKTGQPALDYYLRTGKREVSDG